jgi:hypothetical protein
MVRSKTDRRWHAKGQYFSSEWWNPPDSQWPPGATDAIERIRIELGTDPPADLSCIFLPYPRGKLERLFNSGVLSATERQGALHVLTRECGFSILGLDRERGEVTFGAPGGQPPHRFSAQVLGMLDQTASHWSWAWVAQEKDGWSPGILKSVRHLHEYGTAHDVPELSYEQIALGVENDRPWFNADYLALAACHLCDADFTIAAGHSEQPNLKEFWLVTAPGILPPPESVSMRMFFVIKEALATWGPNLGGSRARRAVESYAEQRNCAIADWTDRELEWAREKPPSGEVRIRIEDSSGGSMYIDFDQFGAIAGLGYPPAPGQQPTKPPWIKRLFGRR